MEHFPEYDEIHVISDIHMGGETLDFQILRETGRLAGYIGWVGQQCPEGRVALVLNGDVFDTLAERSTGYIAIERAVEVVGRIMGDPSFRGIWDALARFVALEGRTLVFVIGNHDIEMSFTGVQRLILNRLAGDDPLKRGRVEFSTVGAGYSCTVGGARVYCTHGNEVDAWNYNHYESLARVGRRLNAGLGFDLREWRPNAGTRMVKEVMNSVKERYKWIDLLKPETQAAVGTLVVLDPAQAKKVSDLLSIFGEKVLSEKDMNQRLSADEPVSGSPGPLGAAMPVKEPWLGPNLGEASSVQATADVDSLLLQAEKNLGKPLSQLAEQDGQLGTGQLILDRLTGWMRNITKDEALRRALKDWLADDKSFDLQDQDDTFKAVTANVGQSVNFIVTGHTHLERAIDMGGGRYYFNCGTWIRLLRFSQSMLKDQGAFKPVYDVLMDGRMETIDRATFGDASLVMNQTSAVSIRQEGGQVVGRLYHVLGDGTGNPEEVQRFARP